MTPAQQRFVMTLAAVGCAVLAVYVPGATVVATGAATLLLGWAHGRMPGDIPEKSATKPEEP